MGAAGLPGGGGRAELTATNERGLIASVTSPPRFLDHLGLRPIPPDMRGDPIRTMVAALREPAGPGSSPAGHRRAGALRHSVSCSAHGHCCCSDALAGARRARGPRAQARSACCGRPSRCSSGALEPSRALSSPRSRSPCLCWRAHRSAAAGPEPQWPRGRSVVAIVVDAFAHTQLLMRSLLAPTDPRRALYGVGNELKSASPCSCSRLCRRALPARAERGAQPQSGAARPSRWLWRACCSRRSRVRPGGAGWGVILVCAAFAVATVMLLPRGHPQRALIVLVSPSRVRGARAARSPDAHGSVTTGSVLHARSAATCAT